MSAKSFVEIRCQLDFYLKMALSKLKQKLSFHVLLAYLEENDTEDNMLVLKQKRIFSKRKHPFWAHNIIKGRKKHGVFYHLVKHLELDNEKYREYFRISAQQMAVLT